MAEGEPLLSVIVVCKNPGVQLATALASVWFQSDLPAETVVIDGTSTDGTVEWLEAHRARITRWISEPDTGVYEAMNKGIALARGEWLLFLGADDHLVDNKVFKDLVPTLQSTHADVVVGESMYQDGRRYQFQKNPRVRARNFAHHQATFYRRTLFRKLGNYDADLSLMADYDFNLRLWKSGFKFITLPRQISICSPCGLSDSGTWRGYAEEIQVRHRYFSLWQSAPWDALAMARFARKKLLQLR